MQGIYNYIPDTNHVSRVYSFASILYLQFMLHEMLFSMLNVLYIYINTFRGMCVMSSVAFCFVVPLFCAFSVYFSVIL